ncbi:MAG: PilZ domain-containing protein [Pseudomonadota bacterium]
MAASAPPLAAPEQEEDRYAPRKAVSLSGLIAFEGRSTYYNCTVKDMSTTGACLLIATPKGGSALDPAAIPDRISLFLSVDRLRVECQVMWRGLAECGVRFKTMPTPY